MLPATFPVEPRRSTTPRADDLLTWVYQEQDKTHCAVKLRDLDAIAFALRLHARYLTDLTDAGERDYCVRIARVINLPDGPAWEPPPDEDEQEVGK